jgi:hypothetical protein
MRLDERLALAPHSWDEITGDGFASRHDPTGRLALRLRDVRRPGAARACASASASTMSARNWRSGWSSRASSSAAACPFYARSRRKVKTPDEYLAQVLEGKIKDPVLGFQIKNGFEPIGILTNYLPEDKESAGFSPRISCGAIPYVDPTLPPSSRCGATSRASASPPASSRRGR